MNWKNILLVLLFADFVGLTVYALATEGLVGIVELVTASAWGVQITFDLVIALTIVLFWMVKDAREREISVAPFVIATLCLGSIGPLAYLIRREVFKGRAPQRVPVAA